MLHLSYVPGIMYSGDPSEASDAMTFDALRDISVRHLESFRHAVCDRSLGFSLSCLRTGRLITSPDVFWLIEEWTT